MTRPALRMLAGLALLAAPACDRERSDPREPLGARIAGASHPVLALRPGDERHTILARSTASLPPATYTAEQAARGADVYRATCARCHPPGNLDGEAFVIGWNEARASTLFNTVRNTMPQDRPGTLSDEQYADVLAYVLQRNHVPPGSAALRPDTAVLRQTRIAVAGAPQ